MKFVVSSVKKVFLIVLSGLLILSMCFSMNGVVIWAETVSGNDIKTEETKEAVSENLLVPEDERIKYMDNEYQIIGSGSWTQAKQMCEDAGGHMVTINSDGEQEFVADMIFRYYGIESNLAGCWLGGYIENEWKWITDEEFNFTCWNNEESSGEEKYLVMNCNGFWDNVNDGTFLVVCEWEKNPYKLHNPIHHCDTEKQRQFDYGEWSYLYFGLYPQTEVTDINMINELRAISNTSGEDILYDNCKYRCLAGRYYKWERIKWRVLNVDNDEALILTDKIIDAARFTQHIWGKKINWENSSIRSYLNGYDATINVNGLDYSSDNSNFINVAFSNSEKSAIYTKHLDNISTCYPGYENNQGNNTTDKIFLLSYADSVNDNYGFCTKQSCYSSSRQAEATDYANALDIDLCCWWLRSMGMYTTQASKVYGSGICYYSGEVFDSNGSLRPALYLDLKSNAWSLTNDGGKLFGDIDSVELGEDVNDVTIPNNAIGVCAVDTDSNRVIENATIYIDGTAYDSGKEGILYFTDNMPGTKHIYYATHSGYNVVPYAEVVFEKGNLYKVYLTKKTSDTQAFTTPQCVYGKLTGLNSISGTIEIDGKEYSVSDSFNEFNNCWSSGDAVYAAFDKNKKIVTLEPIDNHIRPIVSIKSQDTPINYDGNKYSKDSIDLEVTLGCELYPEADIPESLKEKSVYVDKLKLSFDGILMSFEKKGLISDNIVNEKELKINETLKLKDQKSYSEKLYLRTENVDLEGKTDEAYSIHCNITYGDAQTINRLGLMQVQFINLPLQAEKAALKQNSISANPDYTKLAGKIQNFESQMVLPVEISELIGNKNTEKMVRELLSYAIVRDMACFKLKADKSVSDEFIEKVFRITDQSDMIRNLFKQGHITEQINVDTQEYGNQTIMFDVKYDVGGFNTSSPQYGIGWISYKVVGDKNSIKKVPKAYQQSSSKGVITYAYTQDLFDAASKCLMSSINKYYNSAIGDVDVIAGYALDDTTKKTLSALNWGWGTAESIANGGNSPKKKFANYKDAVWYIITEPTKKSVTNGRVKCPVDLYFYNSENELCGAIVNDEVIFSNDEIVLWVDGNEKKFQFLGDEFHIKYVGNDSGTMNCTINRFEGDITIPTRVIELYDVPLTENTIYYGYIPENPYTNNNMYILQEEGGEKIAVDYDSLNITVPVKVDVENIALDNSCLEMHVGDSKQLSYIISPYNATRKDVMWVSNDENVVTVDADGVINAKAQGKTQIIAYILGENEVASCDVTVLTSQNNDSDGKQPEAGAPLTPTNDSETRIRAFVSRMYTVALGREAEQRGLDDWSRQLLEHTNDGAGLARGFICSAEFTNKNLSNDAYVNTLYRTFFDREPDFDGKVYWIAALNRGTKRNEVLAGFVNSLEFANLCDSYGIARGTMESNGSSIYNADVRNYVLRMYTKCLKRDGETIGVEDWSHRINTKAMDPETVAKSFFTSEEFLNKNLSNEDYVETLYETFMDRPSDETGKADWVNKLNSGVSRQTVLEGFSRSPEFAKIMASFGL